MKYKYYQSYALIISLILVSALNLLAQNSIPYTYKDVKIGGGGFVSGIVYSQAAKDLLYVRTDVGGMYRWNAAARSWIALSDFIGDENQSGVLSIAADPSDSNRVYMATGLYTASWSGTGAVFSSADKGNTWKQSNLSIRLGGNEDGRSTGERLQVDPNKGNILFLGTTRDGLWKSVDYGVQWSKVASFPVQTTPNDPGISFVLFDKTSGTKGNATPTIYIAVLQKNKTNFFRSINSGQTWEAIAGAPEKYMAHRAALASDGSMYISYCDNPGPSGITAGTVWKYNTISGVWKEIAPPAGQGGFGGIDVDSNNPMIVMVATLDRWWPKDEIYRSIDGGSSWKAVLTSATIDNSSAPYANINNYYPQWIGDFKIDPFNSNNAWFITGYGVYGSKNCSAPDNNGKIKFSFDNNGLEELVATGLISPPTGPSLLSTVGDQDGFRHVDLDASPAGGKYLPGNGGSSYIDFAQNKPEFVVRTYYNSGNNWGTYSTNQGISWTKFPKFPTGATDAGVIAVSADGNRLIWSLSGATTSYSVNNGSSWVASSGIPGSIYIAADRVNSLKFYGYDSATGSFYTSSDGGATFSKSASGLPILPDYNKWMATTKTVFGKEGNIWITCGYDGLYHSTNSGASFKKIGAVNMCHKVAFGKASPGSDNPAVYLVGNVNNVYGFYQSLDDGVSWSRINDDNHQFLGIRAFTADPNVFGRIYLGTVGRGIIYGQPENSTFAEELSPTNNHLKSNVCYPNPFSDGFFINLNDVFEYQIYDVVGNKVEEGNGNATIHVGSALTEGIYLLHIQSKTENLTIKLIKNN